MERATELVVHTRGIAHTFRDVFFCWLDAGALLVVRGADGSPLIAGTDIPMQTFTIAAFSPHFFERIEVKR